MAGKHLTEVGHGRESAVDDQAIKGSEWVHKGVYLPDCKLGGKKSGNLEGDRECRGGKAWIRGLHGAIGSLVLEKQSWRTEL